MIWSPDWHGMREEKTACFTRDRRLFYDPDRSMRHTAVDLIYASTATLITPSSFPSNTPYASSMSFSLYRWVISGVVSIFPSSIRRRISAQSLVSRSSRRSGLGLSIREIFLVPSRSGLSWHYLPFVWNHYSTDAPMGKPSD